MVQPITETMPMMITYPVAHTPFGTCLWEYDGLQWSVKSLDAENGGVAGDPPQQPGRFKGQLRMTPCVTSA